MPRLTPAHRRCLLGAAMALVSLGALRAAPGLAQPAPAPLPGTPLQIAVTGGPAPVAAEELAIVTAAREAFPDARDAQVTLASTAPPLAPLDASQSAAVQATVQISSPPQSPQLRTFPVTIQNAVLPWSNAQVLLVSNSPESLPFGKVLYNGALANGQTARLLYHHQNGSKTRRMAITVTLSNPTPAPITVWIEGASAGPTADELGVGHAAAHRFLEQYWNHAGFIAQIPANTTLPLFVHDLAPLAVVSGIVQLSLLDGDRLNLQVVAQLAGEMEPPTMSYAPDFDTLHQRGAFARPQIVRALTFVAGGPPLTMTLGADQDLLKEGESGVPLAGNYGVIYTFEVRASNPAPEAAVEALVMHADGGPARGTFLVGDRIADGPVVRPDAPRLIATIRLAPGLSRLLRISTMPESGSNYPVRLLLGPRP